MVSEYKVKTSLGLPNRIGRLPWSRGVETLLTVTFEVVKQFSFQANGE